MKKENFRIKKVKTKYSNELYIPQYLLFGIWFNVGLFRLGLFNTSNAAVKTKKEAVSRIKLALTESKFTVEHFYDLNV
jgi:hypothetical protein